MAEVNEGVVQLRQTAGGAALPPMATSSACTGSTVRFSAEGDYLLAWDRNSLCVWQVATGAITRELPGSFSSAALSGGRILAAEFGDPPVVKSWGLTGGDATPISLQPPPGTLLRAGDPDPGLGEPGIITSPRADSLVAFVLSTLSNSQTPLASLWSADGRYRGLFPGANDSIAYAESGAFVIAGNALVDTSTGKTRFDIPNNFEISTVDTSGTQVAGLDSLGLGQMAVQMFDLSGASGPRLFGSLPVSASITDVTVSPDGARLATTVDNGGILWRLAPDIAASEAILTLRSGLDLDASFTADGQQLLISGDGWNVVSAEDGDDLPTPASSPPPNPNIFIDPGEEDCVHTSARVSNRGTWLTLGTTMPTTQVFGWYNCPAPSIQLPTANCNARTAFSADDSLVATTGPALYRTSDWSRVWPAQVAPAGGPPDLFKDVQFMPGDQTLLVSTCPSPLYAATLTCRYALYSVADGTQIQALPELQAARASVSAEGHWVVSGGTALHLPSGQSQLVDPDAVLSTFAPNGDIITVRKDNTIARLCRTPSR
jgi:hypothetical protein